MKNNAYLHTDEEGDLVVVFLDEHGNRGTRARISECGRPCAGEILKFDEEIDRGLDYLAAIPKDLAHLYVMHGCNIEEYELDRAIWAAEYVRALGGYYTQACNIEQAEASAEMVVLTRWKAK